MNARALVAELQAEGQDFEFYPTTNEIISRLARDIKNNAGGLRGDFSSVLDVGAGNGKVLLALREQTELRDLHAIEKSSILCEQLPADILIVGTDFAEQSLLSKHVDVIFCNPPYREFDAWATKIIRQSASRVVYLVLPARWANSTTIADALKYREVEAKVLGDFDFEDAEDRRARAKVQLLRVTFQGPEYYHKGQNDDAFERFFNEQFGDLIKKFEATGGEREDGERKPDSRFSQLVVGPSYLESLVAMYDAELANVQRNFELVGKLDADLLREFKLNPATVQACLKQRLEGMRTEYWHELFGRLDTITNRLTSDSRRQLLDVLHKHVHVDFTLSNAYAIIIWVIKNANLYIDSQLLKTYELMVSKCNVRLYKSNQRTWQDDGWRYRGEESQNSHFALEYRIVTQRVGGIGRQWGKTELAESAAHLLGDLLTVARNLGWDCPTNPRMLDYSGRKEWGSGQSVEFWGHTKRGDPEIVVEAKAFLNGNVHLRMSKAFMLALNVEHGRLRGWLKTGGQAATELDEPEAAAFFNTNKRLSVSPAGPLLTFTPDTGEEDFQLT